MAVKTIPASEFRRDHNIREGWGEVAAFEINGIIGWAHPNGELTFREETARQWATQLDAWFRRHVKDVRQLETAT